MISKVKECNYPIMNFNHHKSTDASFLPLDISKRQTIL